MTWKGWEDYKPQAALNQRAADNLARDIGIALKKRPKYGAQPHWVDERLIPFPENPLKPSAIRFDSKHEAERFVQLRQQLEAGYISDLELQKAYPITVTNPQNVKITVARYICDFEYVRNDGTRIVEDAKGFRTKEYLLKRALVEALYGITITEV